MYRKHMELRRAREGARQRLVELLEEKERLFTQTQPGAIRYDKVKILSSVTGSPVEDYVMRLEQLDPLIEAAKKSLEQWDYVVDEHLLQLRQSRDLDDIIYVARFIDRKTVQKIAEENFYSASWIYRRLEVIRRSVRKAN